MWAERKLLTIKYGFIYNLLKIKNMDILAAINERCPVGWNVMSFLLERES